MIYYCFYCLGICDGTKHDYYGEWILGTKIIVCDSCDDDSQHEDGPWNEVC